MTYKFVTHDLRLEKPYRYVQLSVNDNVIRVHESKTLAEFAADMAYIGRLTVGFRNPPKFIQVSPDEFNLLVDSTKMKVYVKEDACKEYCTKFGARGVPDRKWSDILSKIQGKILEVSTQYFFDNSFNCIVDHSVSVYQSIGLHKDSVEAVFNDLRPQKEKTLDMLATSVLKHTYESITYSLLQRKSKDELIQYMHTLAKHYSVAYTETGLEKLAQSKKAELASMINSYQTILLSEPDWIVPA